MNKIVKQRFFPGLMVFIALFGAVSTVARAAGETVYLTPKTGLSQTGNTFTVDVDGHVGMSYWFWVPIGASNVQGSINFPATLLKVNSISMAGSSFPSGTPTFNNSTGRIDFNSSTASGSHANKDVHLFTITFQSLAPGSASVNFGPTSYNIGTAGATGGTYTINAPPAPNPSPSPTPKPTPSPTPKPSTKPSPTPTPSATPTPTPAPSVEETPAPTTESDGGIKIQDVKVTANRKENKVAWSVSDASVTPTLTYGTSKNSLKNKGDIVKNDDGTYEVSFKDLKLGTLYYFSIKAATADNLEGATYTGSLTTRGYPVQLTVQQNNLLLPGAKVKIGERSFVANKNAIITTELSDGEHTAIITPPSSSETHTVKFTVVKKAIPASGNPESQNIQISFNTVGSTTDPEAQSLLPYIGGAALLLLLVGSIIGFIVWKRRQPTDQINTIDNDLLANSYGKDLTEQRQHTPEPNLDTHELAPAPEQFTAPVPIVAQEPLVNAPAQMLESSVPLSSPSVQTAAANELTPSTPQATQQTPLADPYDPVSPPLPPSNFDSNVPMESQSVVEQQIPPNDAEDPQLASELVQVEAIDEVQNSEPSAVYHEATGELEILHHHNSNTSSVTLQSTSPPNPSTPTPQTATPSSPPGVA